MGSWKFASEFLPREVPEEVPGTSSARGSGDVEASAAGSENRAARAIVGDLSVSQRAERWDANPTVELMRRWAAACGRMVAIRFEGSDGAV
jgi:hypothetical protein